jgi:hypothetical protein
MNFQKNSRRIKMNLKKIIRLYCREFLKNNIGITLTNHLWKPPVMETHLWKQFLKKQGIIIYGNQF